MAGVVNILTGWGRTLHLLATPEHDQQLAAKRLEVCSTCPEAKESTALEFLRGSAEHVDIIYCHLCKCPCHQKSLVPEESCPAGKWNF